MVTHWLIGMILAMAVSMAARVLASEFLLLLESHYGYHNVKSCQFRLPPAKHQQGIGIFDQGSLRCQALDDHSS